LSLSVIGGRAYLHADAAYSSASDKAESAFHILTAGASVYSRRVGIFCRESTGEYSVGGAGGDAFSAFKAGEETLALRERGRGGGFKGEVCEKSPQTHPRAVFFMQEKAVCAYRPQIREESRLFVGIKPRKSERRAFGRDALGGGNGEIAKTLGFKEHSRAQQGTVDESIDGAVVMKIRMCRAVGYGIDYRAGERHGKGESKVEPLGGGIVNAAETDIGGILRTQQTDKLFLNRIQGYHGLSRRCYELLYHSPHSKTMRRQNQKKEKIF